MSDSKVIGKHTDGPWSLGEIESYGVSRGKIRHVDAPNHGELASVVWQMEDDVHDRVRSITCEANAILIASSPLMLNALETVKSCGFDDENGSGWGVIRMTRGDWEFVCAAIAKAKGLAQ